MNLPLPKPTAKADRASAKRERGEARSAAAEEAIKRDGKCMAFCCPCRYDKSDPLARKLETHHIHKSSAGGPDTADNLITLCAKYGHRAAEEGYRDDNRKEFSGHVPAAVYVYETLAIYRDTLDWRWSEDAWHFAKARYEAVMAKTAAIRAAIGG